MKKPGGRGRFPRLKLQHKMMLWFSGIILALFACMLAFLHLRITREMHFQMYDDLNRTRVLFENIHRVRGEELLSRCGIFASSSRLATALALGKPQVVRDTVADYASALGADVVLVADASGKSLACWKRRGVLEPDSAFRESVSRALAGEERVGVDVSADGIHQTACSPIWHPGFRRPLGALVLGTPINRPLATRLGAMSGAEITFFASIPGADTAEMHTTIVASTLPGEAENRLRMAMRRMGRDPLRVPSEGLESPYVVDMGDGVQYLSATAPIRGEDRKVVGAYVIQRPLDQELRLVDRVQRSLVLGTLVAMAAALLASYALANGMARSIGGVVRAAEALSGGDWSQRLPMEGPEDIRILAEAFNRMAARLQTWDADLRAEVALRTEALNSALAHLDSNLRQMRQFHADASHELRTPLTIMRGEVEVALRTVRTPEEYQRVLNTILEEMTRVSTIVDHLLLLARADSGQVVIQEEPVDLNAVLDDLHEQAVLLARPKRIRVALRVAEEPVVLRADVGKVRQLLLNLVDNAIKYTPDGGSVTIHSGAENGFAMVAVHDTGIGIAEEDIPRIFSRFFRVDRARSREIGGTGLGLAICQWVADAHHGWIDVESTLGQGSTFTVYLPLKGPSHGGEKRPSVPGAHGDEEWGEVD